MDTEERELRIRADELIRETNIQLEKKLEAMKKVNNMKEEIVSVINRLIEKKVKPPKYIIEEIAKMTNLTAQIEEEYMN
jgi:hypothetical protein